MHLVLTPEILLSAYGQGLFPMAYTATSPQFHWVKPEQRGQLPIAGLHVPRRLKKTIRQFPYTVRVNKSFFAVIEACASSTDKRPETWINGQLRKAFCELHELGHAHSVECWQDNQLVGGLYGLAMGGVFFGESMFSKARDASKIALVHLVARLWRGGFTMLDTQFSNSHLAQFGIYDVPAQDFEKLLRKALAVKADFTQAETGEKELVLSYLSFIAGDTGA